MIRINWQEYKEFKKSIHIHGDNFDVLLAFLKSYYNITSPTNMYDILCRDELAIMMLKKRDISDAQSLETYIFKR